MPIIGLTDGTPSIKEIGRIRKGSEKEQYKPGVNLDYFRVTFRPDETEMQNAFNSIYGNEPRTINVKLAYDVWDDNLFFAYYTCYLKGGMLGQANGEQWVYLRDYRTQEILIKGGELTETGKAREMKIAFDENEPVYFYHSERKKKDIPVYAKPEGRVALMVPELGRYVYLTLLTHAKNDLANLSGELRDIFNRAERLGVYPSDIPLVLSRRFEPVSKPAYNGEGRITTEESLVHLEPHEQFAKLAIGFTQRKTLEALTPGQPHVEQLPEQPEDYAMLPSGPEPPENWDITPGPMFDSELMPENNAQVEPKEETGDKDTPEENKPQENPVFSYVDLVNKLNNWAKMYKNQEATTRHRNLLASVLDTTFDGNEAMRHKFTKMVTGFESTRDIPDALLLAMLKTYLGVTGWDTPPTPEAIQEVKELGSLLNLEDSENDNDE